MACHRLQSINIDKRGLFTAIYGLNSTSEIYITNDMRIHNVREALYLYLKGEGYTVIFYDDKAFSYEESPLLEFFSHLKSASLMLVSAFSLTFKRNRLKSFF